MIAKLKGLVDSIGTDWAVIDVGGVGYHLVCSARTLAALPQPGEAVAVHVECFLRDERIRLYGFASEAEREWFRLLLTVQGVGMRVALSVLGALDARELANAVAMQDKAMVARAPGVGQKVAGRIVAELRDRAPELALAGPALARLSDELAAAQGATPAGDAVSALVNLGYGRAEAGTAVAAAAHEAGEAATAETLIRLGLKELAR